MIFVTVGTHEQQFDRLIKVVDDLVGSNEIIEEVIIQSGYCTYEPINCKYKKLFSYHEMKDLINRARIVITHGGPSSFIMPLQVGKIPIVVPRQHKYDEHVNDHQIEFATQVSERMKNIIVCEVDELYEKIKNYDKIICDIENMSFNNNEKFVGCLQNIICEMFDLI